MLRIYNLDDTNETQPISSFANGEHVIGRNTLNCKDARVSRNHALITVNGGSVTLKSTHVNPTFYKPNGGNSIQLVKIETSITLKDGDQFALLPDDFWFKIRFENDDINFNRSLKRTYEDDSNIKDCAKQVKITDNTSVVEDKSDWDGSFDFADVMEDPNELNGTDKNLAQNDTTSHSPDNLDVTVKESHNNSIENLNLSTKEQTNTSHPENIEENKADAQNIPQTFDEPSTSDNNSTTKRDLNIEDQIVVETTSHIKETDSNNSNNKNEDDINARNIPQTDDKPDTNTSTNNADAKRVRCWYGKTCYRRNPNHKRDFSHPGDSDYEEADEGTIAACPFGDGCYRTNINHRKQYKHSKPPAPKPPANPVAPCNDSEDENEDEDGTVGNTKADRKKRKVAAKKKNYADSPEGDYDLEDPFINDGSSDDFELSDDDDDDSSDSDWQDSQAVSEESQETKRMIREARKFTKKKK